MSNILFKKILAAVTGLSCATMSDPLPPVLVPQSFTIFTGSAVPDDGEKDVLVGSANQIFPVYSRKSRRDIPQYVPLRHENTSMGLNIYSIYQIF